MNDIETIKLITGAKNVLDKYDRRSSYARKILYLSNKNKRGFYLKAFGSSRFNYIQRVSENELKHDEYLKSLYLKFLERKLNRAYSKIFISK